MNPVLHWYWLAKGQNPGICGVVVESTPHVDGKRENKVTKLRERLEWLALHFFTERRHLNHYLGRSRINVTIIAQLPDALASNLN